MYPLHRERTSREWRASVKTSAKPCDLRFPSHTWAKKLMQLMQVGQHDILAVHNVTGPLFRTHVVVAPVIGVERITCRSPPSITRSTSPGRA